MKRCCYVSWPQRHRKEASNANDGYGYGDGGGNGDENGDRNDDCDCEKGPGHQVEWRQASTLMDLLTIRAFHILALRRQTCGSALGFRIRRGLFTSVPAILVLVARKINPIWIKDSCLLPRFLTEPGGLWCDLDVIEFESSSSRPPHPPSPPEEPYSEFIEGLQGNDVQIGPGSQVSSFENLGTIGVIVQSKIGAREIGILTSTHVAFELGSSRQDMFHPVPPNYGNGMFLGTVARATTFVAEEDWYQGFGGTVNEAFVRSDGAFVPFPIDFDMSLVTPHVKGVGELGEVFQVDLKKPIGSFMGKNLTKLGRSTGLTRGQLLGYAFEYADDKGARCFTDFIMVADGKEPFDLEGDSGSVILLTSEHGAAAEPLGIILGGSSTRGRLKLRLGERPVNWTIGVDLGRLLDLLELDIISTESALQAEAIGGCHTAESGAEHYTRDAMDGPYCEPTGGATAPFTSC